MVGKTNIDLESDTARLIFNQPSVWTFSAERFDHEKNETLLAVNSTEKLKLTALPSAFYTFFSPRYRRDASRLDMLPKLGRQQR